jgi:hypothetical protein
MCMYLRRHHGEATNSETAAEGVASFETGYGETVPFVDDEPTVRLLGWMLCRRPAPMFS